jgi:site-specific DNA-methyltransferase (adenine-specific)
MLLNRSIFVGDNLVVLNRLPTESVDLIYIDPPFNTHKMRTYTRLRTDKDPSGDRTGFGGKRYRSSARGTQQYADSFEDYISFLEPRLNRAYNLLTPTGSLFFHIDYRESHYCKILLDKIFGRDCFQNEIIWAYDYGGRSKTKWPCKHDTIFWYTKHPTKFTFNYSEIDRIPYMAPGLVGPEKAKRGKTITDTWWHTIVPTNGRERTGYPTQKPIGILKRIISVHSNPGDMVLDFFAGAGTTGEAAAVLGRAFVLVDNNLTAIRVMQKRLQKYSVRLIKIQ